MKHTPGPWEVHLKHHRDVRIRQVVDSDVTIAIMGNWSEAHEDEQRGNARLIAAAPELYVAANEAIELLLGGYTTKEGYEYHAVDVCAALDLLRAAIAKAGAA